MYIDSSWVHSLLIAFYLVNAHFYENAMKADKLSKCFLIFQYNNSKSPNIFVTNYFPKGLFSPFIMLYLRKWINLTENNSIALIMTDNSTVVSLRRNSFFFGCESWAIFNPFHSGLSWKYADFWKSVGKSPNVM